MQIYTHYLFCIKLDEKIDNVMIQALNPLLLHIICSPHNMLRSDWLLSASLMSIVNWKAC